MKNDVKESAELLKLAEAAERHLRARGHDDVTFETNDQNTAFDITRPLEDGEEMRICRVQSVHGDTWEVVRANGETVTGLGNEATFCTMIEKVVEASKPRAGR